MDLKPDDVVYVIAMRTRAPNRGRAVQEAMRILSLARADEEAEYTAHVIATDQLSTNFHERLCEIGFDWDTANEIAPVATEVVQ